MTRIVLPVDGDHLAREHADGASVKSLAAKYGCSRTVIASRIKSAGGEIRNRSQAMYARMAQATPAERAALASAAHDAVRGVARSDKELVKRAVARERRNVKPSRIESQMGRLLEDAGYSITREKAIGPYNADIALDCCPVAVELFGGRWHAYGRHADRARQRFDYFADAGWFTVVVWCVRNRPLGTGALHKIIADAERSRSDESMRGQYRMILGDGQNAPALRSYLNDGTVIDASRRRDD